MAPTRARRSHRRLAVAGDLSRLALEGKHLVAPTRRNVEWLSELLQSVPALRHDAVLLEVVHPAARTATDDAQAAIGGSPVWDAYAADATSAWAARFDGPQALPFPGLQQRLLEADLVIGFELPPALKRFLHGQGRRYLSVHIHPLRMLRDLCLGATTNCPLIAAALACRALPAIEVQAQVHRFRALCRFHRQPAFAFPEGLPVLVGQTERDSVLIHGGRFVDWPDREDALAAALQDHEELVFIEHPFRADSRRVTEYLRCRHGKTVIATNANGYGLLLSAGAVPKVLTLSSSLGVEAAAFGWPTEFLLADPRQQLQVPGIDQPFDAPLGHGVLDDAFWLEVLEGTAPTPAKRARSASAVATEPFARGEHYLRDSLESWSYQLLRTRLAGSACRKTLMPHAGLAHPRQQALTRALLSPWPDELPSDGAPSPAVPPGVTLEQLAPPVALGGTATFRGGEPAFGQLLGRGFHPAEGWGAWSSERRSELLFSAAAPAEGALLRVTLDVGGFEGTVALSPVLTLSAGGQVLGVLLLRAADARAARVSVALLALPGLVRLVIELSHLTSPRDAGQSSDARQLGFGLTAVELELRPRGDSELQAMMAAPLVWGLPLAAGTVPPPATALP